MKTLLHLALAVLLLTAPALRAGNVINTLGNAPDTEVSLGPALLQFATAFTTGSAPGKLASITVRLRCDTVATNVSVHLWSSSTSSTVPETLVADLGSRTIPISAFADWTFVSSQAPQLTAGTRYWVSVTYEPGSGGGIYWRNSASSAVTTDSGASMANARARASGSGVGWTSTPGTRTQLFSVTTYNPAIVVTTTADDNNGATNGTSLREALAAAASAAGPDLITFAPGLSGQSIQLSTHSTGLQGEMALYVNNTEGISIDASSLPGGITITRPAGAPGDGYHALYLEAGCSLTLRGLTLSGFKAPTNTQSGAIFSLGTLTLDRCTLTGNSTNFNGGAIYNQGGTLTLTHCTLSGNASSSFYGGAIFNFGTASLTHCTLSANTANISGGGIYNHANSLTLTNCIVAGNTATGGSGPDIYFNAGTVTATGKNLLSSTANSSLSAGSTVIVNAAPLLAGLAYYGGGTATLPPLAGSPAIDPTGGDTTSSSTTDQRGSGFPRVVNGTVDIGAVEYSASASALSAVVVNSAAAGLGSLVDTISAVPAGGTITFAATLSGATISPASLITLDKNLTIDGTGLATAPIISGSGSHGIFAVNAGSTVVLTRLSLQNGNSATGGGIDNAGTLTVNQSTLSGNQASFGGGIDNDGTLTLTQSTLSGNHADNSPFGSGGGIYNGGTLTVNQSTLSGNQASFGGGIYSVNADTITLTRSLIAGNTITSGTGPDVSNSTGPAVATIGVNFIGDTAASGLSASSTLLTTAQNGPVNLLPLGNYGGPTQTMPPMAGSPAIDATSETTVTDQRGFSAQDGDANGSVLADIGAAEAQVMLVTTATDEDDGNTTPGSGTGTSLREAIADTSGHADIIRFDPAVFNGQPAALIRLTVDNAAAFNQQITIARSLSVDARNLPSGVTLSGDSDSSGTPTSGDTRIFEVTFGQTVALHGLTLQDGNAPTHGGGILNFGTLTLNQSTLTGNHADGTLGGGGGIYNGGTLTVNQSTLSGNHADGLGGGGGGGIYNTSTLTVNQSTLYGNHADNATHGGGGIYNNQGTLTVTQSTLSGNHADSGTGGGGISNSGTLTVNQSTLSGNHADNGRGGAIFNFNGTVTVNQSTLSGNHADNGDSISGGGAVYSATSSDFTSSRTLLTHCTLTGNTASTGGGIRNNSGRTTLTHCTVSGNTAAANQGSGVASYGSAGTQTVVENSIISGNGGTSVDYFPGGTNTFQSQGRNLIGSGNATGAFTGTNIINDTPQLAALASNGGPTQTMALLPGSPALNAAVGSTATTDQRGFPIYGTANLGAYTVEASSVALVSSANPSLIGQSVTFTATVTAVGTAPAPTGSVTFTVDGVTPVSAAISIGGTATFTTSALAVGARNVTATYIGDITFLGSSATVVQTVNAIDNTDNGPFSLRQALINAAANPGPDTITLPIGLDGQTLTLLTQLPINDAGGVTIDASGLSNGFTISGGGTVRLFTVAAGSTVTLKNLTLINGKGVGGSLNGIGGAIYNNTGAMLTLDGCTLSGHSTAIGGAIFNNGGVLTLTRCAFTGNAATDKGGAVNSTSGLTALGCTFSGNTATSSGGALYTGGTASLTNCTFTANAGQDGGGVFNQFGGVLALTHCTLAVNSAISSGGGIASGIGALTLTNCIVAQNTAASGADISNSGSTPFGSATVTRVGVNIVRSHVNSGNTATDTGPTALNVDPLLNVLGNYGGPTPTMPLLPGSPALDQASVLNPALTTDQRGFPRPVGVRPDIGAVEGTVIIVTTPVDELDAPGALGNGVSLREAVRDVEPGGIIVFDRAVFNSLTTNTLTLTKGPLNPQRNCTLNGSLNPGGITIINTLTITAQPVPLSVASTAAANFAVVVTNLSGGLAYQWRKDGSDLGGQTNAALALANVTESDEALYDVTLSEAASPGTLTLNNVNLTPASSRSQPASLIVDVASVTVKRGPSSAMLALGGTHTLSVVAIGPALPAPALTYQWKKNGVNLSGATKSSYVITNAQLAHAGAYTCLVKSGTVLPGVTSTTAEIGVVDARPKTVNLLASPTASFTPVVSAAGNGLGYAWFVNGTPSVPTKLFPLIKPVGVGNAGLYTCTVTGLAGTITTGCNTRLNVSAAVPTLVTPLALPQAFIGQAYFYQLPVVSTVGAPATSFSVTGTLPSGMSFNKTTGVLTGRPTVMRTGGYSLSFKAINAKGPSPAAPATLTVNIVPPTALGTFAGPMARSPLFNANLGGRFDLATSGNGTFSGGITLGARTKISFTAKLLQSAGGGDVILFGSIPGITLADKTPLIAYVEVFAVEQLARLTLVHPTNGTTLITPAWRNPWLLSTNLALNNPATKYATKYSLRLDAGIGGTVSPSGYGYASFTVNTAGALTLAGKLPDGSAVSGGAFVSKDGEIALFNLLYATNNRGSHVGQFIITAASPVTNNVVAGNTSWFKPAPLTATSTDTIYKPGFGPLTVLAAGGAYVAPLAGQRVLGLPAVLSPNNNAKLSYTLGGLDVEAKQFNQPLRISNTATGLTNTFFVAPFNALLNPNPNPNRVVMTVLTASTGAFAGSFTMAGATTVLNRPAPYFGQIVKIGAVTEGYGYFLLPTVPVAPKTVTTAPKLSGRVVLGVP